MGIDCTDPEVRLVEGNDRLAVEVAEVVQTARWRLLVKQRATLRGLRHGRDENTMAALIQSWPSPVEASMLGIIHSDSVYTPVCGHLRWGLNCACPLCRADKTVAAHFVHWCPTPPPSAELQGLPDCVIYSGNVPKGRFPKAPSLEMCGEADWGPADSIPGARVVATDGSSRRQGAGFRRGWGVVWGPRDCRNCGSPLRGPEHR